MADAPSMKLTPVSGVPVFKMKDQPPERPTQELEKVPAWAVKLTEKVIAIDNAMAVAKQDTQDFRKDVCEHLHTLDDRTQGMADQLVEVTTRVAQHSMTVKGESKTNLNQDAAIASIITEQAAAKERDQAVQASLAKNTELTQKGVSLAESAAKNPVVIGLVVAVAVYFTTYLGHLTSQLTGHP